MFLVYFSVLAGHSILLSSYHLSRSFTKSYLIAFFDYFLYLLIYCFYSNCISCPFLNFLISNHSFSFCLFYSSLFSLISLLSLFSLFPFFFALSDSRPPVFWWMTWIFCVRTDQVKLYANIRKVIIWLSVYAPLRCHVISWQ